ncbi:MAG TPA: lipocalin family protein [Ferruginibacter sp.]|nr:lipocalin family protein [Ferruginibacter sp.]
MSLFSCRSIPEGVSAVPHFQKNRYLGKWYEIARIDFKFEKNLNNTTATYGLRPDGKLSVLNQGYNYVKKKWKQARGKAKLVGKADEAMLKVSFFGPFYAGYNVIRIDAAYQYALVAGRNFDYLWILSRTPNLPDAVKTDYLQYAQKLGFDTSRLIWVQHDRYPE